ncbi:MAG: cytochrome c [Hydrogenophilaceae bacterium]|nr:cytochrome c [Hydrogenophilaceae bacterium]
MSTKSIPILLVGCACLALPALADDKPSLDEGKKLYRVYCASCHGKAGKGDGPGAGALKTPPYNLTWSSAKDDYLRQIIAKGGAAMERSPEMPPWAGAITPAQIDSVIIYIKTLRAAQ